MFVMLKSLIELNPIILLLITSFLLSLIIWLTFQASIRWLKSFICFLIIITIIYYLGMVSMLMFFLFLLICSITGYRILNLQHDGLIGSIISFFIFIELYIVFSLVLNPQISMLVTFMLGSIVFLYRYKENITSFAVLKKQNIDFLISLNVLDIGLIVLCFILGSLPQSHWDAVHANLYTAKWYIENNSFRFLPEGVSSLYPQNAIGYYSFFYQLGGIKGLQIAYITPLVFLLVVFKRIKERLNFNYLTVGLFYSFFITPIVIFQASNGYYDLLVLSILLAAIYISYFNISIIRFQSCFLSMFLIGFAAGMKYFPILFLGLPIISYLSSTKFRFKKDMFLIVSGILISTLPLYIWLIRAYYYTGSPIFPFFQYLFPTPGWWPNNDILENNFMIQTPVSVLEWVSGGFITYPVMTFFYTHYFIEATNGYPSLGYIVILLLEVSVIFVVLRNIFYKKVAKIDIYLIYSLMVFILVGVVTRYYRYLWPYQTVWALVTLIYFSKIIDRRKINNLIGLSFVSLIIFINLFNLIYYYSYIPIVYKQLFKPDYYFITTEDKSIISYLNNKVTEDNKGNTKVLDASANYIDRFHLESKVYQCSWYWIGVLDILSKSDQNRSYGYKVINDFDYIITDKKTFSDGLCSKILSNYRSVLEEIYSDLNYTLYKVKHI